MDFSIHSTVLDIQSTLPTQVMDWGVELLQAPKLWTTTKGEGMKVAILDTGVDFNHMDLAPNIKAGMDFTSTNPHDYLDQQGHGTHCAGIVAGIDNEIGVVGVAPMAELYIGKVLGNDGSGDIKSIIDGIYWAIQQNVDIISMSLGCSQDPGPLLQRAIQKAREAGIIVVAASGNESGDVGWPARYPEVIAVGAIDQALNKANFSNFGQELDVVAPGVNIYSTYPTNRYACLSGTSMATPMIAGLIALIQGYCRKIGVAATPEVIVDMISRYSKDLGQTGSDAYFGNGLFDVNKLLEQNGALI